MKRRPYAYSASMSSDAEPPPSPPPPPPPPPPSGSAGGGRRSAAAAAATSNGSAVRVPVFGRSASALERGAAADSGSGGEYEIPPTACLDAEDRADRWNYALLIALYTLQGIPMGLSASVPFLIQQKVKLLASRAGEAAAAAAAASSASSSSGATAGQHYHHPDAARLQYNAQAIFALCSWPFSLKLLWAPVVDAVFSSRFGRRKSWLVPAQAAAGAIMVMGSGYVERQLGLGPGTMAGAGAAGGAEAKGAAAAADGAAAVERRVREAMETAAPAAAGGGGGTGPGRGLAAAAAAGAAGGDGDALDVRGVTAFFFALYFLMATQDVAVDGWALTMLSRRNRGKGPLCNSIGQNLGYFLSFVGFLALNDAETSERLWRPMLGLPSRPGVGLVSLGGFVRFTGVVMLALTTLVAIFKSEAGPPVGPPAGSTHGDAVRDAADRRVISLPFLGTSKGGDEVDADEEDELDASKLGLGETYRRLWAACKLPAVRSLFLVLLTYRLPTALSDNVKFLKAVEFGLSKQTAALLGPLLVLPLGIAVPIVASRVWRGRPLRQFMDAYRVRVTLVAVLDVAMLLSVRALGDGGPGRGSAPVLWASVVGSTAAQAVAHSLQFNAQMTFFAHRVDPAIGGSYMTLLNTAANLGGTWPASFVLYWVGRLTVPPDCVVDDAAGGREVCTGGRDAYFPLQAALTALGCLWIYLMGDRVRRLGDLPDDAWRTHIGEGADSAEVEMGDGSAGGGAGGGGKDRKQA